MFELRFVIRIIRATSAGAKQPVVAKDESSASSSSVCKHITDNDFDVGGGMQF